ncbi:MAG: transporter substrate-binding domain-containing protein [Coriobacteriales bacterium]|jgi:ABC-type amino acid transport substrate-binding protein|nr:transporter substrate-binding domain-containing protein [Coriobacteriales bacterium]
MQNLNKCLRTALLLLLTASMAFALMALSACGGSASDQNANTAAPSTQQSKYTILPQTLTTEHYGVGFKKGDTDLRDAVEVTLVAMYKDGTIDKIAQNYADKGIDMKQWVLTSTKYKMPADKGGITTLTVGFDQGFPPFGYQATDGSYTGFDLDLAKEVCTRMGWVFKAQPINWDAKDAELSSGDINCIWNGFTIEGREDQYTWTDPYMNNRQVIVVKSDSGITDFNGLANKNIVAQNDSSALNALKKSSTFTSNGCHISTIAEYSNAFLELDQGSVDAIAIDYPTAGYQIYVRSQA